MQRNLHCELSLIDLNPAMGTRAKRKHAERLSERAPFMGGAIVCSHGNWNHEKSAEMTDSCQKASNKKDNLFYAASLGPDTTLRFRYIDSPSNIS